MLLRSNKNRLVFENIMLLRSDKNGLGLIITRKAFENMMLRSDKNRLGLTKTDWHLRK